MSNNHFQILDGSIIEPQPWMQERVVASVEQPTISRDYDVSGGSNKNDLIHTVELKWTNNTPMAQWVYGEVTRGGVETALQARSRAYVAMYHAMDLTPTPAVPATFDYVEVSRTGCGMDVGRAGLLAAGSGFAIIEDRENSNTTPFMPHLPYWQRVGVGETIHCRVGVRFVSQYWESSSIDGGDSSTQSGFISGSTTLDLWAVPIIEDPGPRLTPTIVGVSSDRKISTATVVNKVAGVAAGDTILVFHMNQWGSDSSLDPVQAGWQLLHRPAKTEGFAGLNDVHLRVYRRIATGTEPANYSFGNEFIAEATTIMVVLRNASELIEDGWYAASAVRKRWWERDDGHIAPSIDRRGQFLLNLSFIAHALSQWPITQVHPEGTTELIEISGAASGASTVSLAYLANPPRPTQERKFVPNKKPVYSGRNISVSILLPGKTA